MDLNQYNLKNYTVLSRIIITATLDPKTAEQIIELTRRIVEKNRLTVLMVTHNMKLALEMGNIIFTAVMTGRLTKFECLDNV